MESLWRQEIGKIEPRTDISQSAIRRADWDVVVVGAGLAGILTAYHLKEQGKQVLVVEAKTVASGQTERTTAKITSQHGLKYAGLIKAVGERKAKLYAQANEQAIAQYAKLVREKEINCRFERADAYLYSEKTEDILKEEAEAAEKLGIQAEFVRETELPLPVKGALCFRNQAQFSPLSFVKKLAEELDILAHTRVMEIKENWVITDKGILTADAIVVTSHYPIRNVPGFYFLRQHQERSYVLALSGCKPIKNMYYGIDGGGLSFRQAGDCLLLGGSSHRTGQPFGGKKSTQRECTGAYEALRKAAEQYFPNAHERTHWSAQDCMPHDGIPFIGTYSMFTPHLYVATGFQKWGMTTSMIAAKLLCDEICGKENPYQHLFSPQRLLIRAGTATFLKDAAISAAGLGKGLLGKKRCSHMGCALKWNPDTQSFDCPCHGSRFDRNGKLLDNPAQTDLSEKKRL